MPGSGGRPKGSRNRTPSTVADGILQAWDELGGAAHLASWGRDHPTEFYALLAKLLPKDVRQELTATTDYRSYTDAELTAIIAAEHGPPGAVRMKP